MAGNPRIVTADAVFMWDHAPQRLGRGTIIDVPAGSALEAAIGPERLIPLHGAPPVTQASEPAPEPVQEKAPRSPAKAAAAKAGKDADTAGADPPDTGGGERM